MSRFEYRVSYRREANKVVQEKIFRQLPAARRFITKLSDPKGWTDWQRLGGRLMGIEWFAIDRRDVGAWERVDERGTK